MCFIDTNGVPSNRESKKYHLCYNDNLYPPKYVLSIASKIATGKELEPFEFNGGHETNNFLMNLGFTIKEGNEELSSVKKLKITTDRLKLKTMSLSRL